MRTCKKYGLPIAPEYRQYHLRDDRGKNFKFHTHHRIHSITSVKLVDEYEINLFQKRYKLLEYNF